jgi:mannose-6-phosphate isomerase-like protein (cupin superfamily)
MKRIDLSQLMDESVSHNPEIKKRVLFSNGEIPNITQYAQARLEPGQVASGHTHMDMWEMFLCVDGNGTMKVNHTTFALHPGICVLVEPGEMHEIENTSSQQLVLNTLGVVK